MRKQLPLSGGQGGSAASAVAGAVAADALIGGALDETSLLLCALAAAETVAGRHLDNIAPSLLGGIVLVRSVDPIDVVDPDRTGREAPARHRPGKALEVSGDPIESALLVGDFASEAGAGLDQAEAFAGTLGVSFGRTRLHLSDAGNVQARARARESVGALRR